MSMSQKKIIWYTPTHFIDVDILVVPEIAKKCDVRWIIFGTSISKAYQNIKNNEYFLDIKIDFYEIKRKWYSPFSYCEYKSLFCNFIKKDTDVIYINMAPQLFAFVAAKSVLPKDRAVFATHNVKTPKGARHEWLARYYMNRLIHTFQNFHVFSKNQQDYLEIRVHGKNVLYAPLVLKDYGEKGMRTISRTCINFLSFGHIRRYKRVDLLIEAAQQLYEETGMDFRVTIAGNCPNWKVYAKRIRYPNLFDLHIGFVDDGDVPNLFANADYLVLPYQDLAQSGAITVSFNYGVPVITSDILQFREFVKDGCNGFLFQSESIKSLKQVMRKVLELSPEEYEDLLNTTNDYVTTNYSLKNIVNFYIEYFNRLI